MQVRCFIILKWLIGLKEIVRDLWKAWRNMVWNHWKMRILNQNVKKCVGLILLHSPLRSQVWLLKFCSQWYIIFYFSNKTSFFSHIKSTVAGMRNLFYILSSKLMVFQNLIVSNININPELSNQGFSTH